MNARERVKRLETRISQDAGSQASRQLLQETLTEYLHALRAWARQNQQPQIPGDAGATEMKSSTPAESHGSYPLLQQVVTEYLRALRAWTRQNPDCIR
jgi:hypothetical protein